MGRALPFWVQCSVSLLLLLPHWNLMGWSIPPSMVCTAASEQLCMVNRNRHFWGTIHLTHFSCLPWGWEELHSKSNNLFLLTLKGVWMTCLGIAICSVVPTVRWDKSPKFPLLAFLPRLHPPNPYFSILCPCSLSWVKMKCSNHVFTVGLALETQNLSGYPYFHSQLCKC